MGMTGKERAMGGKKKRQKIILPPELPPDIPEEEVEVSDEDLQFFNENKDYAGFVSTLDTQSITRHVSRVADVKEDALEALYERRLKKKAVEKQKEESELQVDPVDALPVKTLDGKLYYRTLAKKTEHSEIASDKDEADGEDGNEGLDKSIVKLTKAERRAKLKKNKKEAKKQGKELAKMEDTQQTPQAAVLAEVQEDITAEETFESKKRKLAELGMALLSDPEANIKSLKEMLQISKDDDQAIVKLALLSLSAVFKDIIPGYHIRLPTEKELEMTVSKEVKKKRYYESTLLSTYKAYLQKLMALERQDSFQHVAVRCICTLLDAVPHFNFRESLLAAVIKNIGSSDDVVRKLCCGTVKSLFINGGKHGGEATVEAVQLIADHVKSHDCQLHPDSIEVFMHLTFDEDLGRPENPDKDNKVKNKKTKKRKNRDESGELQESDKKKSKKVLLTKMREEVNADFRAASFALDVKEQRRMQSEALSAVFETYFRILKHCVEQGSVRSEDNGSSSPGASRNHPLLVPCLMGLGKFSHLIDLDFMGDLMNCLRNLASGGSNSDCSSNKLLTVSERLQCCIVAFKIMRNNLEALNVDLQEFFIQLYNLIIEYRPGRDQGAVLAEALKIMLCDDRQHDMQKASAFIKRLATFSLCFGAGESMAALVTSKHLLQKNVKCRNLLENDAGGGSVSGSIAKYQPYATDPSQSGALASVLWDLNLLSKHYHPAVSTMASNISIMNSANNQVCLATVSPQQAFADLSIESESFFNPKNIMKSNHKRKRGSSSSGAAGVHPASDTAPIDEDGLRKKLSEHFMLLRDIKEKEKLKGELDRVTRSLQVYEEYKNHRKQKRKHTSKPKKNAKAAAHL